MSLGMSIMINGEIGDKGFLKRKHVEILNNVTDEFGTMVNADVADKTWQEIREDRMKILNTLITSGVLSQDLLTTMFQRNSGSSHFERVRAGRVERSRGQYMCCVSSPN